MKRIMLGLLCLFLMASPAWAITQAELEAADETLRLMDSKISRLREFVQVAARGQIGTVILTSSQKQSLKDSYAAEKGDLQTLFLTLP